MKWTMKAVIIGLTVLLAAVAQAFPEIPKASAKALRIAKGKSFSTGLVFINGKFIDHPYVVERYGTGIRINGIQVTGQVIDWNEFLKTQEGVKVSKSESTPVEADAPAAAPAPAPEPEPEPEASSDDDDDDDALDDLFDDEPKAKKKPAAKKKTATKKAAPVKKAPPKPKAPVVTTSYSLEGDFVPNDATKAMVKRINDVRTEIDRILRAGGFICFGDSYSRISGDARTAKKVLDVLPEIEQRSRTLAELQAAIRAANLVYFNDILCQELFRNRIDYRVLQERREKIRKAAEWKSMLNEAPSSLF